jgi:hypothetical protein
MSATPWLFAVAAATLVVLIVLLARAVFLGYPPPTLPGALLGRKEQAVVAACADALFPPGGPIPLSGTEAGLVAYMDLYVRRLPRGPRLLGRLLFHYIEHSPWIFGPRHVRFTRLRPEERVEALRSMADGSIYFQRLALLSLRAMMTMGYLANPRVAEVMGMVTDTAPFEHRAGGLHRESFA